MGVRANPPVVVERPDWRTCNDCGRRCDIRFKVCSRCKGISSTTEHLMGAREVGGRARMTVRRTA